MDSVDGGVSAGDGTLTSCAVAGLPGRVRKFPPAGWDGRAYATNVPPARLLNAAVSGFGK